MLADVIRGYAAATIERVAASDNAGRLASDVEAFSTALVSSESLRWALIDPNISPVARRSIVADLLVNRVSSESASLIAFVVRVAPPAELAVAIADLVGLVESASSVGEPATSLGASRERLHGYAERVLEEVSSADEIDEMEDAFFRLARILEQNAALRHALTDPGTATESRLAIIRELFGAQVTAPTLRIVSYAISAGRVRDLVGTFDWLVQLTAEERGRRVAQVRSAVDLDDAERERLAVALRHLVGREVEVRVTVDPTVIGGVLIAVGDLVIDGTVRLRVERLRDALAESA